MIIDDKVKHIQKSSVSFKFKLFLLFKLPMGFLCGMRIKELNNESCQVTVPYKWLNKNPFKSTFWAVLGMAAEMNGAALLLQYTQGQKPPISTYPISCEAEFFKKATDITTFTCNDGLMVKEKVIETMETGEGITFETVMKGLNPNGDLICKFKFIWSIKRKSKA